MTKASASRRQRRFERRGRPTSSYKSLFKDNQRFSIAGWLTFEPTFGPHVAARAVTVWFEDETPIAIYDVEGLLIKVSADYDPRGSDGDLDDHARDLSAKAKLVTSRATEREFRWLTYSSGLLSALVNFYSQGDLEGFNQTIKALRQAGWGKVLDRIARRLVPALLTDFPPFKGEHGPVTLRLLAALRAIKGAPKT